MLHKRNCFQLSVKSSCGPTSKVENNAAIGGIGTFYENLCCQRAINNLSLSSYLESSKVGSKQCHNQLIGERERCDTKLGDVTRARWGVVGPDDRSQWVSSEGVAMFAACGLDLVDWFIWWSMNQRIVLVPYSSVGIDLLPFVLHCLFSSFVYASQQITSHPVGYSCKRGLWMPWKWTLEATERVTSGHQPNHRCKLTTWFATQCCTT